MIPQTDKSCRDYRALNQNWSYQPTLAGRAIRQTVKYQGKSGKSQGILKWRISIRYLTHSYLETQRQTVQTQIRCHIMWHLIRVYLVCWQDFPSKIEWKWQTRSDTPKMTNGVIQHITMEESTSIQWVKCLCLPLQRQECWSSHHQQILTLRMSCLH